MEHFKKLSAPIYILYGTSTGNSEVLAEETAKKLNEIGLPTHLASTEEFNADELYHIETLLLLMSTDDDGTPPIMAEDLYRSLNERTTADLNHLSYSVLALGDSYYPDFCQAGKDFDEILEQLGAHKLAERVDCDIQFWTDFEVWLTDILPKLKAIAQEKKKKHSHMLFEAAN